ncbi:NADH dehydrogenase subunit J [Sulfodiicoccus acidiphilus]|uniref:NADH dehydrogenase subunit J n=1 Tax=Sulfodiicoccus acidiphilus TaxID=1670455 RepID=A0A348B0W9_9CREN|nr:NADH-quinone oxidoreductase subunit J [Sulfodiicoccus acidiphilus]BBD71821.1 NADH dehydrogenase subunit J [Sulfodiicoccus acidiphilus]GGT99395.1 NADH dehydrogenase subunit J [Sulfodiicoccus acidiphilus]
MSLPIIDIELPVFVIFSVSAIISSLLIVNSRNVFYSAVSLGILGISVAVIIALLNPEAYALYSAIHLLLYVGATVVFIAISLVLFRGVQVNESNIPWASPLATVLGIVLLSVILVPFLSASSPLPPQALNLTVLAQDLLVKYWFPTIIIVIALATTLVEAITLARRD